jgi:hypothetical protein
MVSVGDDGAFFGNRHLTFDFTNRAWGDACLELLCWEDHMLSRRIWEWRFRFLLSRDILVRMCGTHPACVNGTWIHLNRSEDALGNGKRSTWGGRFS